MFIVKFRKLFYLIAVVMMGVAVFGLSKYGLNIGIDFKGGADLQVAWQAISGEIEGEEIAAPAIIVLPGLDEVRAAVEPLGLEARIRPVGDNGYDIKTRELTDDERADLERVLRNIQPDGFEVVQFSSLGPILGAETMRKSIWSIVFVMLCICLFITFAFRQVSRPIKSWKYAMITLVTLTHDLVIPLGVYAFLGYYLGVEVDTLFVAAILTVLGFSVHNTIVVFDRIRERLRHDHSANFEEVAGKSVMDTFARSMNTSFSTLMALFILFFIGGIAVRWFTLTLIVGVIVGTYSSVFLASPLLVTIYNWQKK